LITINNLIAARKGELTAVAGRGGADRLITWAHAVDLPDPWSWVQPGDLVLTTGSGLPEEAEAQGDWMTKLADVGVSGLVVAPRPGAPQPTSAMLQIADQRSVPLIIADFTVRFSRLIRIVCESVVQSERDHISTARRLFDLYSGALRSRTDLSGRLDVVARSVGWAISVTRRSDGAVIASGGHSDNNNVEPIDVQVPGQHADVIVRPDRQRILDGSLVQFLAGLVGIELAHLARVHRERQRQGGAVLQGALDGSVSGGQLRYELATRGMGDQPVAVAILRPNAIADMEGFGEPQEPLLSQDAETLPLVATNGNGLVAVVPADWTEAEHFQRIVNEAVYIGLSMPVAPGADLGEAYLQARIAAAKAGETGESVVSYMRMDQIGSVGPRSLTESRSLVGRVLGPLIEHDRSAGTDLLRTLDSFLSHDRSWTRTADALGIHRQTLVYRITQIERLTGLKPASTAGTATLWTALQAGRELGAFPPHDHASGVVNNEGKKLDRH
jgi:purine catabolism regulator